MYSSAALRIQPGQNTIKSSLLLLASQVLTINFVKCVMQSHIATGDTKKVFDSVRMEAYATATKKRLELELELEFI